MTSNQSSSERTDRLAPFDLGKEGGCLLLRLIRWKGLFLQPLLRSKPDVCASNLYTFATMNRNPLVAQWRCASASTPTARLGSVKTREAPDDCWQLPTPPLEMKPWNSQRRASLSKLQPLPIRLPLRLAGGDSYRQTP
jgi:hypothetical protein